MFFLHSLLAQCLLPSFYPHKLGKEVFGILVQLFRSWLRCDDLSWGWNEIAIITTVKDRIMPGLLTSQIISSHNYHHVCWFIPRHSHWVLILSLLRPPQELVGILVTLEFKAWSRRKTGSPDQYCTARWGEGRGEGSWKI